MKTISIIIPVYNSAKFLKRCIDSILSAQIPDIKTEIIIINDGSTDNSLQICTDYSVLHKNIVVVDQSNKGLSAARNAGLNIANGNYISFVDSDDTVTKDYFKTLNPLMDDNFKLIHFGYNRIEGDYIAKSKVIKRVYSRADIKNIIINSTDNKFLWFVWRRIYHRDFFVNKKVLRFDEDILYGEDSVFLLKILNSIDAFVSVDSNLYNYYDNPSSLTGSRFKNELIQKFENQYFKRKSIYISDIDNQLLKKDLANNYINHSLMGMISNVKNAPPHFNKLDEIKRIRDSIIFQETFHHYTYNWKHPKRSLIIKLFELKKYRLLFKLLKINA